MVRPLRLMKRLGLSEPPFDVQELHQAIHRMKLGRATDEVGLAAELLRYVPEDFLHALLHVCNHILVTGDAPAQWRRTLFQMLPKHTNAKPTADFRPIASVRVLYKVFAYLLLGRIEDTLEASQPEEQHGFRAHRRIEEHLLTMNVVLDKTLQCGKPVWVISLDLSKAFDRVDWAALWDALRRHGVSNHIIWLLQCLYQHQTGTVIGETESSKEFDINCKIA